MHGAMIKITNGSVVCEIAFRTYVFSHRTLWNGTYIHSCFLFDRSCLQFLAHRPAFLNHFVV